MTCTCEPSDLRRRERGIPRGWPDNLSVEHLMETFARHPWLEEHPTGALAVSLRDAVVMNA